MLYIKHRQNSLSDLSLLPTCYGAEIDIRSHGEKLILQHDPYIIDTQCFDTWISEYRQDTLILNVKEEGLEERLINEMISRNITNYFFLDQSIPFLIKWASVCNKCCAARVSEYESIQTVINLANKISWVWIDCFNHFPIDRNDSIKLKNLGLKICLVSPELHGKDAHTEIPTLAHHIQSQKIEADAVCTKRPDIWESIIK